MRPASPAVSPTPAPAAGPLSVLDRLSRVLVGVKATAAVLNEADEKKKQQQKQLQRQQQEPAEAPAQAPPTRTPEEFMDLIAPNGTGFAPSLSAATKLTFARVNTSACKDPDCPKPHAGMDLSFNGKRVCSACGVEDTAWTSEGACKRTFEDGPDNRQNQEYKDEEHRDLHNIEHKDAPFATQEQLRWANNRHNQITVWADLLGEDSREDPEGISLTEDEVNKMKYAARAVCVTWARSAPTVEGDDDDAEYASASFWSSMLALEMMARRPDGFVLPAAKRHLGNLEGLHNYMKRYQGRASKRYVECKGAFFTKAKGVEAAMAQNLIQNVATRHAAWHPLGAPGTRAAKIEALDGLLKTCGVWAKRDAKGRRIGDPVGLSEPVRIRQLPGVLTSAPQQPTRSASVPEAVPHLSDTRMGITYRHKAKHSLYAPVPLPKPDKKRKRTSLQPLPDAAPQPPLPPQAQEAPPPALPQPPPAEADGPLGVDDLFGPDDDALLDDAAAGATGTPGGAGEGEEQEEDAAAREQTRAIELLSLDLTPEEYAQKMEADMNAMMLEYQQEQADEETRREANAARAAAEAAAKAEEAARVQAAREEAYKAGRTNRLNDPRNSLEDPGHDAPDYETLLLQGYKKRPEYKKDTEIRELSIEQVKNSGNFRRDPWSFLRKWKQLQAEWREAEQDKLDRQEDAQQKRDASRLAREEADKARRLAAAEREQLKLEQRGLTQLLSQGAKMEQAVARAEKQGKATAFVVPTEEVTNRKQKIIGKIKIAVAQPVPGNKIAIPANVLKQADEARDAKRRAARGATSDWDAKTYKERKRA